MFLTHLPWQIQLLILIICILVVVPGIIKVVKKNPKFLIAGCVTLIIGMINIIFIILGENFGESIGITVKHVDILHIINAILIVLSITLLLIGTYQKVKHDEEKRKLVLRIMWLEIICFILFIIIILL